MAVNKPSRLRILAARSLILFFAFSIFLPSESQARATRPFTRAKVYKPLIPVEFVRRIGLPRGYHEGLLFEGDRALVNNGAGGKTLVVDLGSGDVVSEITPPGSFSEGLTVMPDGRYWMTDWDTKKLYLVRLEEKKMVPEREISLAPAHPTGVALAGDHLYVITWTRGGLRTEYHLLKMDISGNVLEKVEIKNIHEPCQLAWDGRDLWISSWFSRRVYRVDAETFELKGYFRSGIERTTGIAWDGSHFWITGTKADLYRLILRE